MVEVLLKHGANREHRNVSDYTGKFESISNTGESKHLPVLALSLAASGGYVNIIKLLLSHGAEINSRSVFNVAVRRSDSSSCELFSRTGSKLGITVSMANSRVHHGDSSHF